MADRTTFKQLHKEQSKVKISADFLVIIGMISIAAILVSIWIAFFLNFGKDAEVLKHEINKNSSQIRNMNEKIQIVDQKIENYYEIMMHMDRK